MLSDTSFGQYYPTSSLLHKMDARAKIVLIILLMVCVFLAKDYVQMLCLFVFLLIVLILSHVPFSYLFKSLKPLLFLIVFTSVINLFTQKGGAELVHFWVFRITSQGLYNTGLIAVRLFMMFLVASFLTLTTTPVSLTDGLESLLKPLNLIKFPVHDFALIMSIALRMIPTLMEETDRIIRAQKARGADFESGNIFRRAKALLPILIPLLLSSINRASDLADAMESRCYSGAGGRTRMKKLKFGWIDLVATILCIAVLLCLIFFENITQFALSLF